MSGETAALHQAGPKPWRIGALLQWTHGYLHRRGIESARLDAEVLLAHSLGVDRLYLYTHYDQPLQATEQARYRQLVQARARYTPVAYLLGYREFYGHRFAVRPGVFIPRPETEHVVEAALALLQRRLDAPWRICDMCCGSGAVGITLALALPQATVLSVDASPDAVAQTQVNAAALGVASRVTARKSDLFSAFTRGQTAFDLVVANPPYVAAGDTLPPDVQQFEPHQALFSGPAGLDVLQALCEQAPAFLRPNGGFVCEMGADQWPQVQQFLQRQSCFTATRVQPDLQGHLRVAVATFSDAAEDMSHAC